MKYSVRYGNGATWMETDDLSRAERELVACVKATCKEARLYIALKVARPAEVIVEDVK